MRRFVPLEFPPWIRWGQRSGALIPMRPRGPNGSSLCGWCDSECVPPRRRWCSDVCARKYVRVSSWGDVSRYVRERDGTCQRCGTKDPPMPQHASGRIRPWDVDHIVPVVDGGTDDPENLRLLCYGCHVAVGHEQRAARRAAGQETLPLEEASRA